MVKQLKDDSAKTSKELESIETTYKKLKKKKNSLEATIKTKGRKEMKEIIIRYILISGLISSGIWLGSKFSWERIATLLFSLAVFITSDRMLTKLVVRNKHDYHLFNNFLNLLPYDGGIKFIEEFNMGGGRFKKSNLDQLKVFCEEWTTPEHEFLDKKLEKIRGELHEKISEYLNYLATNTWGTEQSIDFISIPPEWKGKNPTRFYETVEKLHKLSEEVVELYRQLVKLGIKKKLKSY